ncbi:glycosyltransferase family 4 protein [Allochromatium palmeri]|uniref:Glycosyltransferase n=1 Tax=Allochromatium palmeri TaxID=231048 RepID=A0A6N8EFL7_9GAMM|nr:glycosyltransferase family 4 protein [Allochromatium palmeri]MTW23013.1 glycosyltransferase [Allochromatium palmeri]
MGRKILFIHQNMPGQFKHLAAHYGADPANRVWFITKPKPLQIPGVEQRAYTPKRGVGRQTHRYLRGMEDGVLHAQAVANRCVEMRRQGEIPDVIVAHSGWGESLYVKDIFPEAAFLNYSEFFFRSSGGDMGFDPPGSTPSPDAMARLRTRNAQYLLALEACDWALTPTRWQWSRHPSEYQSKISVIHEGVDVDAVCPKPRWRLTLRNGQRLSREDEVITYVARNLEPYRGFHIFMRALPRILARRPKAQVLIIGADGVSYGAPPADGVCYRERLLKEVKIDPRRVHFLGRLGYENFLSVLRISSAHIYLTYPFVLSWSMIEAMACGCLVIGSATAPVQEVIRDGHNGLLVDFFSPEDIARRVDEVFAHPDRFQALRDAARQTAVREFSLRDKCLPAQVALVEALASGVLP